MDKVYLMALRLLEGLWKTKRMGNIFGRLYMFHRSAKITEPIYIIMCQYIRCNSSKTSKNRAVKKLITLIICS